MLSELAVSAGATASVIPTIIGAHALYFRRMRKRSTQHPVVVRDHSAESMMLLSISGKGAQREPRQAGAVAVHPDQIVVGDLHVTDEARFVNAIKVTGDLIIDGCATFEGTVVVNGYAHIKGDARFLGGLLVKADLKVDGFARFGGGDSGSWCVARNTLGDIIIPASAAIDEAERLTA